jgi:hypothetical protein
VRFLSASMAISRLSVSREGAVLTDDPTPGA